MSSTLAAMEAPAWRVGGEHQRVNAPLIFAADPFSSEHRQQKPQLTEARETSRVMIFEWKSNDATVPDTDMAI